MELTEPVCKELSAKLEKLAGAEDVDSQRMCDILRRLLETDAKDKLKILSSSRLSKTVFKLTKRESLDAEVVRLAEQLVEKWRKLASSGKPKAAADQRAPGATTGAAATAGAEKAEPSTGSGMLSSGSGSAPAASSTQQPSRPVALTGDSTRDSVRQKLQEAFQKGVVDNESRLREHEIDTAEMAQECEESMFGHFGGVDKEYKQRFRSLMFNLRDPKNPEFILSVVSGQRHVNDLAGMEVKEMASKEVKTQRTEWVEQKKMALMDAKSYEQYTGKQQQDGILKCPKCKSMKTEYTEVQTRSADEPTTKKCFCNNCNYRWKFC